ncbi:MAG TPA: site-2 protease family protein [Verrucomicrobiae bacterium]|nr:site-2 protease family protein [Verrucomicrobiae bacterium]
MDDNNFPPPQPLLPQSSAPAHSEFSQRQYDTAGQPIRPTFGQKVKKSLAPIGVAFLIFVKYLAKLKFLLPFLKTGLTMLLSIGAYAMAWGWQFAVGFVLLIFVHECGHLIAAKRLGLKVGAPVFIPFMGALIALKEAPRNAWIESQVGIGGPLLGTLGAVVCEGIYLLTGNPMFRALAYTGFFLNLFNLAPVGFLDGGRIVTALSPWLWIVGFAVLVAMTVFRFNFLLLLILAFSLPRLFFLFRRKTAEELRYFEVTPSQRLEMGALYFGLILFLVFAMELTHIPREALQ